MSTPPSTRGRPSRATAPQRSLRHALGVLCLASVWAGHVHADDRFVIAAPAPGAGAHDADYTAWLSLSRRLETVLEGSSSVEHPAAEALAVCTTVLRIPVARAPSPTAHAALAQRACGKALELIPLCRGETPSEKLRVAWERAFQRLYVDSAAEHCGSVADARLASDYGRAHGLTVEAGAVDVALPVPTPDDERPSLEHLLGELPCGRARDLRRVLADYPNDATTKSLLSATTTVELDQRWTAISDAGARFQDVVAYHLAEAVIALRRDTEALYGMATRAESVADAEAAAQLGTCLAQHDRRSDLPRRVRQLQRSLVQQQRARERKYERASDDERACCKVCSRGCACGDSCISCEKQCHRGPGCACDE